LPAIASQRAEDVAGQALRMDSYEWRLGVNVSHDKCHRFFLTAVAIAEEVALKAKNAELAPTSRKLRLGNLLYYWFGHDSHNYKLLDWIPQGGRWFQVWCRV
jgi:hypothetical protein